MFFSLNNHSTLVSMSSKSCARWNMTVRYWTPLMLEKSRKNWSKDDKKNLTQYLAFMWQATLCMAIMRFQIVATVVARAQQLRKSTISKYYYRYSTMMVNSLHTSRRNIKTKEKAKVVASPNITIDTMMVNSLHTSRRNIKTKEKAKVVASVWGEEFIQILATLSILPRTMWKNRMNSFFSLI